MILKKNLLYEVRDFFARIYCAIRNRHVWATFPTKPYTSYSCKTCHTDTR